MEGPSGGKLLPPDAKDVAVNRLRFLTAERAEPAQVRPSILASWHRSRDLHVAADKIEMQYLRDPASDTPLSRSAEPILRRLNEQLAGQAVSIVLTDATGLVLSRRTPDTDLERHLDKVRLAPGFSYAEQFVGTNGIGTALEAGRATQVFGHEHYAENLETLACAGVPIHDPINGRLLGLVDLTCWRKDAESLLLTLAEATAEQIQQALLTNSSLREYRVLQAYRQTCRRTAGIVFALTGGGVMLNEHARTDLEPGDQAALLAHAEDASAAIAAGRRRSIAVTLPTGTPARMSCQQVDFGFEPAGLVVHVKLEPAEPATRERAVTGGARMLLPGLVGESSLWQRACHQVETAVSSGAWLALEGEPGTGKLALLRAVQLRQQPPRRFVVLDAVDAATDRSWARHVRSALAETDNVIVTHVDALDVHGRRRLAAALEDVKRDATRNVWVAVTLQAGTRPPSFEQLLSFFPTTVGVPPLRLRLEDLAALVTFLLGKLGRGRPVSCSPEAMRLLMRSQWPGNVAQLQMLLHKVVQRRRSGTITPDDLPPELHSVSRRVLSPLESMERDAIVQSLADSSGNKVQAARALGMSRATIYRKIHEFGIVTPG